MTNNNTKKDIEKYLNINLVSHLVWDKSKQCMVEVSRTSSYKTSNCQISSDKANSVSSIYPNWYKVKYTEEEVDTKPLPDIWKKLLNNKCTCGGKFAGGSHSDWCDSLKKEDDEMPF